MHYLAKLHTHLVEGVDAPDHSLNEDLVLVHGNKSTCRNISRHTGGSITHHAYQESWELGEGT